MLNGCDSTDDSNLGEITSESLSISLPQRIRDAADVDLNAVQAVALVNGAEHSLAFVGNRFQANIAVPSNSSVSIELSFVETLPSGAEIILAKHDVNVAVASANETVLLSSSDYNTNFDDDSDGFSNIAERELGTDPLSFSDTATQRTLDLAFNLPAAIPDPQVTQVIATFAGVPRAARRIGNRFLVSGSISTATEVTIEIILLQQFNNQRVVLATATQTLGVGVSAQAIELNAGDFDFREDPDGDGRNNVDELRAGTNPFVRD